MVKAAAPNTIRLRFALVDAKATNVTENTLATYTPFVSTGYNVGSVAFKNGIRYFAGTATAEGYGEGAKTGKVLWQAVNKRDSTTSLAENTLNSWLDVQHALQTWSGQMASRPQELGVCKGAPSANLSPIGLADLALRRAGDDEFAS